MKTTLRFDQAIHKLYTAFHRNTLNPECCKQCAVGNLLDQSDAWKHFSEQHGSHHLSYVGQVHEALGRKFNGYRPSELLRIETAFLLGCGFSLPLHHKGDTPKFPTNKDTLFNGLEAAVAELCLLDGRTNMMDCSQLFQYEPILENKKMISLQ